MFPGPSEFGGTHLMRIRFFDLRKCIDDVSRYPTGPLIEGSRTSRNRENAHDSCRIGFVPPKNRFDCADCCVHPYTLRRSCDMFAECTWCWVLMHRILTSFCGAVVKLTTQ